MHVARFAADEGFVRFHFTGEQTESAILQRIAKAVSHEPSGLLGHSEIAGQFAGTDAVLAVHYEPEGGKPLVQTDGGILKYCPGLQRKCRALVLGVALPNAGFRKVRDIRRIAVRAFYVTVRPSKLNHDAVAVLESRRSG